MLKKIRKIFFQVLTAINFNVFQRMSIKTLSYVSVVDMFVMHVCHAKKDVCHA